MLSTLNKFKDYVILSAVAFFGWYSTSLITEVRTDVKLLLETRAIHIEHINEIESEVHDIKERLIRLEKLHFKLHFKALSVFEVLFDKPKTLTYDNNLQFIYS